MSSTVLLETRKFLVKAAIGALSIVGAALIGLVVKGPELAGLITGG